MSYVDMNSDVRWKEAEHVARVESFVRSSVLHTREHVLLRRSMSFAFYMISQMLPDGNAAKPLLASFGQPLSSSALAELTSAAAVFAQADVLASDARADSARLDMALDYEEARAAVALLADQPHPPRTDYPDGTDGDAAYASACSDVDAKNAGTADARAAARVAPQAVVDAATTDTLALVAQRDAYRASLLPTEPTQ